jgi:hypothetical protein
LRFELHEGFFNGLLAIGYKAKAKQYARKAVEAAAGESGALKQYIEEQARMFDDDKH